MIEVENNMHGVEDCKGQGWIKPIYCIILLTSSLARLLQLHSPSQSIVHSQVSPVFIQHQLHGDMKSLGNEHTNWF